jgi:ElaB/YqjD/DUF883 family membrane-anchored ribosome-binding protein
MTTRTGPDQQTMAGSTPTSTDETTSLSDAASSVAGEAGKTVEQTAAQGMTQVSDVLHQVADAARQASEGLQSEQPQIGRFIMTGADKLDEAASYIAQRRPAELMDGAQSFARSQPAVVIGGALAAGLVLGRLLRTAGAQSSGGQWSGGAQGGGQDWYSSGYQGQTGSLGTSGVSSGVSSGYGTGYGATYDRSATDGGSTGGANLREPAEG